MNVKKITVSLVVFIFLAVSAPVFAVNANTGTREMGNQGTSNQEQQGAIISSSPIGHQVQNQNQVQTQNQGEDLQLQVHMQEQENLGTDEGSNLQNRSSNAIEHMNEVAQQVQELQQIRTTGGIGEQVRQIAQEQNQAQVHMQAELTKVENRGKFLKLLIGSDYQALKTMQKQIEQNQLRIQQLEQLENQLTDQGDITMIQETIQALIDQNTALQNQINLEEQSGSLLGWLFKMFAI